MKICMIIHFYYPYESGGGGAGVAFRKIAEALKKSGHDVFVIATGPYKNLKSLSPSIRIENGIRVYYFYPIQPNIPPYTKKISNFSRIFTFLLNFWNPHTYFVVKKILKKEKPDVVNIHETLYLSLAVYSAAKSLNLPVVSTIHSVIYLFPFMNLPYLDKIAGVRPPFVNYKIYEIISNIYAKINRFVIGSPKHVAFVSNAVMDIYSSYEFFKRSKKTVFPNIFEIDEIELKKEKINKETFDILYTGRLTRNKGAHTLIKAVGKIHDGHIRLHLFGNANAEDNLYFKKLAEADKRIIFYGQVPNKELLEFYKIADVTVIPSIYFETFGRVIIESFNEGVPVIGSKVAAIPEIIQEGYNGFLFEPGNVQQLKEILEYAILNRDKLKEMRENCINTAKKYSVENNIYKLEEIYKEAIKFH